MNKFAVVYSPALAHLYPEHVKDFTPYGRLLNNEYIVNLNVSLFPDNAVSSISHWHTPYSIVLLCSNLNYLCLPITAERVHRFI